MNRSAPGLIIVLVDAETAGIKRQRRSTHAATQIRLFDLISIIPTIKTLVKQTMV
jgi:hypothetical protein